MIEWPARKLSDHLEPVQFGMKNTTTSQLTTMLRFAMSAIYQHCTHGNKAVIDVFGTYVTRYLVWLCVYDCMGTCMAEPGATC